MKHNIRSIAVLAVAAGVLLVTIVAAILAFAAPAFASSTPAVKPGSACATLGATGSHAGQAYRCEQKPGAACPTWSWVYDSSVPKSGRSSWPTAPCNCTPSASPSSTPSTSPSPSGGVAATTPPAPASPTTSPTVAPVQAGAPSLPVTGDDTWAWIVAGVALLAGGLVLIGVARPKAQPTNPPKES